MGSLRELDGEDVEKQAAETSSSTVGSDVERREKLERLMHDDAANGSPDPAHEDVEQLDAGHQVDLELQKERSTTRDSPRKSEEGNSLNRADAKGHMSRVAPRFRSKGRKEQLEREKLPEIDLDSGIVGWDGQDDPLMPLNFPESRKWLLLMLIASITFISPLASSMFAPAVSFMDAEFQNSSITLTALAVSIFVLGYCVGPLVLSPLSEIYGRRPVLGTANAIFCVWQIGCALAPNLGSLIAFRFLAGIGGSGCLTIGGGVIADLFPTERRGLATSVYTIGPLFGPVLGPICGGFISQRAGWRWVFWVLFIASSLVTFTIECLNQETNPRVLIYRKTLRLRRELDRPDLRSCYDEPDAPPRSHATILRNSILRPLKMLFRSPIVFLLSTYMSVVYGLLYLLFTTITGVFQLAYGWQPEICGLAYIPLGIGFFAGVVTVARLSDATVIRMTKANNGVFEPEMRLPACIIFACFVPISFFWYGWAVDKGVYWPVSVIGLAPFSFGMIGIFIPTQTYLIDSFPMFAASAVATLITSRSLFGTLLPLAGPSMYKALGLGWGNSLLGFIALALIPAPALIYKFGGRIRKNYPIRL